MPIASSTVDPLQLEPQGVAWRGAPQERLLDWSSSLASQHLSDEAPGVFTITDRKVGLVCHTYLVTYRPMICKIGDVNCLKYTAQ